MNRALLLACSLITLPLSASSAEAGAAIPPPPPAAATGDWTQTFSKDAFASSDLLSGRRVIVVAAGGAEGERDEAASALLAAIRAAGQATMVMDQGAIGDASAMTDEQVIEKANKLPVDVVAVLRVFPSADGALAAIVFYGVDGSSVGGASATRGVAMTAEQITATGAAAPPAPEPVAEPEPEESDDDRHGSVADALKVADDSLDERIERYNEQAITGVDWHIFDAQSGRLRSRHLEFRQGKYGDAMRWDTFYRLTAPGKLSAFQRRRGIRVGLMLGGTALALGGITGGTILLVQAADNRTTREPNFDSREIKLTEAQGFWGGVALLGVGLGGVVASTIGGRYNPHPLKRAEMVEAAIKYNEGVAAELGLEIDSEGNVSVAENAPDLATEDTRGRPSRRFELTAAGPMLSRQSFGFGVSGNF